MKYKSPMSEHYSQYHFIELNVDDPQLLDELEQTAFDGFACAGSQDFSVDEAKVDEILGERSYSGGDLPIEVLEEVEQVLANEGCAQKILYFSSKEDAGAYLDFLDNNGLRERAVLRSEEGKDWNESWKKSFQTIDVTDSFSIIPYWEKETNSKKGIYIYPGMGFGTGNHETTFLCAKTMLEKIPLSETGSCLDFGCGSGILGIAFSYANPDVERVDYLDIDQQALENCRQNIAMNESALQSPHKVLLTGEKKELQKNYDLVFANILLDALIAEKDIILAKARKYLILSGLLAGQEREVIEVYKHARPSLDVLALERKNDWVALLMRLS